MRKILTIIFILFTATLLVGCGNKFVEIKFQTNGGTSVEKVKVRQLSSFDEPSTTKTGYEFKGWFEDSEFNKLFSFKNGSARNLTLYAKWEINSYELIFQLDNGEDNIEIAGDYNTSFTLPTPEKEGYTFGGWYTDLEYKYSFEKTRIPAENLTLYAKWSINSFVITFYVENEKLATRTINYNQSLTNIPIIPEVEGYSSKWNIDNFDNITSDLDVYAIYTKKVYTVIFKDQENNIFDTLEVDHGDLVTPLSPQPSKIGFNFRGYSHDFSEPITKDIEIFVLFDPITYTVRFRGFNGVELSTQTINEGDDAVAPTPPAIVGYTFTGWDRTYNNVSSNFEVNAIYQKNTYSLVVHANNGVFLDNTNLKKISYLYLDEMSLPEIPTREGYNFSHFSDENDNIITFPKLMDSVDGYEIYAKWQIKTYSITYQNLFSTTHGNGLQYNIETPTFTLTNPTNRRGYTFEGWYDQLTGGNLVTKVEVGSTSNLTLYARWSAITYTITYENLEGMTHANPVKYNIETPLIELSNPSVREGYIFEGWYDQLTGGNLVTKVEVGSTSNLTLYARWSAIPYSITYENLMGATNTNQVVYDILTPRINLVSPGSLTHYTFAGWYDQSIGGNEVTSIEHGSTGNKVIYARWEAKEYVITFMIDEEAIDKTLTYLDIIDSNVVPNIPDKTHYDDVSPTWNEDPIGHEVTGAYTFTAVYTPNLYTITFESNGGSIISDLSGYYNTTIPSLSVPTKVGYTFGGWYIDDNSFEVNFSQTKFVETLTLYAKWTEYPVISFESNGGSSVTPISKAPGETISAPNNPERNGYNFAGWYTDNNTFNNEYNFTIMPSEDVKLYARWSAITYTITYENLEGMTHANPVTYNIETPLIELSNPSVREGYNFIGWFDQLSGGNQVISIEMGTTSNLTLYARWSAIPYSITYENLMGATNTNQVVYNILTPSIYLVSPGSLTHYTFAGWYDQLIGGNEVTSIEHGSTGNKVIYARWEAKEYVITFMIDGVAINKTLTYLDIIDSSVVPNIPDKTHYDDVSPTWNEDPIGHEVTGAYTFTAVYTPNLYTITFDTNNGETMAPISAYYNTTLESVANPIRLGYQFIAWYTDIDLIELFDINNPILGNITLYATYEINYYNVEVDSIFEKEDLEDNENIIYESTTSFIIYNVLYGDEISPIRNYEGYTFYQFEYNGDTYINLSDLVEVIGNISGNDAIKVYYRKNIVTITFNQDPDLFGESNKDDASQSFRLYYNESFNLLEAPALEPKTGFDVAWNRTIFDNLREDLSVYALYYESGVKSLAFNDRGTIKYLVSQQKDVFGNPIDEALNINSPIWTLSRLGYKFIGWFSAETGGVKIEPSNILFSELSVLKTVYYARWEQLESFNKPENILISVDLDESEIVIEWTLNPPLINDKRPESFKFVVNNVEFFVSSEYLTLQGLTYTLNITSEHDLYNDFKVLLEVGKYELTIQARGDLDNHYHGATSNVKYHSNDSIFDQDPTEISEYDYFIVEQFDDVIRYVFYSNLTYVFGPTYTFEIVTGHEFASVDNNKIITNNLYGSFRFRMIRQGYETKVYDALVVPDVRNFSIGSNYQTYLNSKTSSTFLTSDQPYFVGTKNNYHLDIRILNNQGSRIALKDVILDYELYEVISGIPTLITEANLEDYIKFYDYNEFRMNPSTVGKTFEMKVTTKYQATEMTVDTLTYRFSVNNGHNAFTNQQLKTLFSNLDVSTINIHANIHAELVSNQINSDGSPINKRPTVSNRITGDVYSRYSNDTSNDNFRIEGNYMTIDGSNLPYSNGNSGSGLVGFAEAFEIVNVQIAIFGYHVTNDSTPDVGNNKFSLNNLQIIGNTTVPSVNISGTAEEILQQEQLMSRNSGGYVGIIVSSGEALYTNLDIRYTLIAITHNSYGYKDESKTIPIDFGQINYVKINDTWANSIYSYGSVGIEVKNSEIGQSGGPAIHIVDSRQGGNENNPTLVLYNSTNVNNWISGEEAWFKAYGMSSIALQLKSGIQNNIQATGRSIIKEKTNPITGLTSEMLNLILLTEPTSGAEELVNELQNGGSEVKIIIIDDQDVNHILNRDWDYLDNVTDPRVSGGQFGFPVGKYSAPNSFITFITLIMETADSLGVPMDQKVATDLAVLAAFYNLNAEQVLTAYGAAGSFGGNVRLAIETIYPTITFPRYLEVLSKVPVFPKGYSTVIIELD